jgi:hypothetical protein
VAALDIGKAQLVCCIRVPGQGKRGKRLQEVKTTDRDTDAAAVQLIAAVGQALSRSVGIRDEGSAASINSSDRRGSTLWPLGRHRTSVVVSFGRHKVEVPPC